MYSIKNSFKQIVQSYVTTNKILRKRLSNKDDCSYINILQWY